MASILENKNYDEVSVFLPENLLREARRQKNIRNCSIPQICILDPDGDLANYLQKTGDAKKNGCWACYHSTLFTFQIGEIEIGIIPCIVGASYAVLVAEQLFVSGCRLLISVTSSGIINQPVTDKHFALITDAVRDEGTSYHYLPAETPATIGDKLFKKLNMISGSLWFNAKSWTTDAPYRETQHSINAMQAQGVICVEMEAAALYAFAKAKDKNVVCFAHLTNTMAQSEGDFEKGEHFGSLRMIELIEQVIKNL
jgi:uridine phosphorylase